MRSGSSPSNAPHRHDAKRGQIATHADNRLLILKALLAKIGTPDSVPRRGEGQMSWVGRSAFYVASSANLCGRACQSLINRTFNRALLVPIAVAVMLAGFASPAFAAPLTADHCFQPYDDPPQRHHHPHHHDQQSQSLSISPRAIHANPAGRSHSGQPDRKWLRPSNTTATGGSTISVLGFPLGGSGVPVALFGSA